MNIKYIILIIASLLTFTTADAQKRKTSKKKKAARTTKVVKSTAPEYITTLPIDSLANKVYQGVIGKTVVDFFGTRETYGDVRQQIMVTTHNDYVQKELEQCAIIRQLNGAEEVFIIKPYTYENGDLVIDNFTYKILPSRSLQLQKTTQKDEAREGTLDATDAQSLLAEMFRYGKYLSGMSIQTDEDKANSLLLLTTCKAMNYAGAAEFLQQLMEKRVEKGDAQAMNYLLRSAKDAKDYKKALDYADMLIDLSPNDPALLADKGAIYLLQGKKNDAKKIWKKLNKLDSSFAKNSKHDFCVKMR